MPELSTIPRGAMTEICGPASSGRTGLIQSILKDAARNREFCALIDCLDTFDPWSAAGMDLRRLLWVRCGRDQDSGPGWHAPAKFSREAAEEAAASLQARDSSEGRLFHAMRAADMILHSGGFGVVVLDLCEVEARDLNRIPLSYWYRFRGAVENTPARMIVMCHAPLVRSCARLQLDVKRERAAWRGSSPLFDGIEYTVNPRRQRMQLAG